MYTQDTKKKKKKGKDAAAAGLPPVKQVKGVWYGRGPETLKFLDLSGNRLGNDGAATLLAKLYVDGGHTHTHTCTFINTPMH